MDHLLTPREVSAYLKISVRAVYILVRQKRLMALRVGRKIRVALKDLQQFIQEQRERETQQ